MKISGNEAKTELKVTFIDIKEKSVAIGLLDSYKDFSGDWKSFFWNCTCINKAKEVALTLQKGDLVNIRDADISVKGTKGSMLVYNMEKSDKVIAPKSNKAEESSVQQEDGVDYGTSASDYSADVSEDEQF